MGGGGRGKKKLDMCRPGPVCLPPPLQFPREGVESVEKGRILLTISYSAQDCALTIGVDRALDLPAADSSGLADPYIKWYGGCPVRITYAGREMQISASRGL